MIHTGKPFDTAIIGGGILGLWAARHAIQRGENVVLIEKRKIGSGASGGFLGALMPHMPDGTDKKKAFQWEGLSTLEDAVGNLEKETGLDCGYRLCGRIMPVPHEKMLLQVEQRTSGAGKYWSGEHEMALQRTGDFPENWINPEIAKHGVQYDTFSARINPRNYLAALEAYARPRCETWEGSEADGIVLEQAQGMVLLKNGERIIAGKIIVANGWEAYPLLQPFMGPFNNDEPIGRGVKGQAVLVSCKHKDDLPIVYHDGVYVVPHASNRVAIGSTSVNQWQHGKYHGPDVFDPDDMDFYQRAVELVPALKNAPVIERWAAVRPRNTLAGRGTEPWFGPVPGHENLIALIGGFKITLGVAHLDQTYTRNTV